MSCISLRASIGFRMLAASIAPLCPGTGNDVDLINEQDGRTVAVKLLKQVLKRSSKSPRYFVPATIEAISSDKTRFPRAGGNLPRGNALGQCFASALFPDTRLPQQAGDCFSGGGKDLHHPLQLTVTAQHRVQTTSCARRVRSRPYFFAGTPRAAGCHPGLCGQYQLTRELAALPRYLRQLDTRESIQRLAVQVESSKQSAEQMLIFGPAALAACAPQHSKLHRLAQLRCKVAAVQPARCALSPGRHCSWPALWWW